MELNKAKVKKSCLWCYPSLKSAMLGSTESTPTNSTISFTLKPLSARSYTWSATASYNHIINLLNRCVWVGTNLDVASDAILLRKWEVEVKDVAFGVRMIGVCSHFLRGGFTNWVWSSCTWWCVVIAAERRPLHCFVVRFHTITVVIIVMGTFAGVTQHFWTWWNAGLVTLTWETLQGKLSERRFCIKCSTFSL